MTKLVNSLAALCLVWAFGPSNAGAESLGPTLQKIKDAGTITIGNRDSSVPFSYLGAVRSRSASRSNCAASWSQR